MISNHLHVAEPEKQSDSPFCQALSNDLPANCYQQILHGRSALVVFQEYARQVSWRFNFRFATLVNQDVIKFVVLLDSMSTLNHWIEEYMEYCRVEKGLSENSLLSY